MLDLFDFDPTSSTQRSDWLRILAATWPELAQTDSELLHEVAGRGPGRWAFASVPGSPDTVVGTVRVEQSPWFADDVPPLAWVQLLPPHSTVGNVTAALEECRRTARELGHRELRVLYWEREAYIAEALAGLEGWREVERECDMELRVADAPPAPADQLPGYRIVTLEGRPELERAMYDTMCEIVHDVPGDEVVSPPPFERWLELERRGPHTRDDACFLAVDDAGEVGGYADLELRAATPQVAWHGYTGVRRAHRGRGVAQALKHATIGWARANGVERLRTENEERNAPMRAINTKLGYRPSDVRIIVRGPI